MQRAFRSCYANADVALYNHTVHGRVLGNKGTPTNRQSAPTTHIHPALHERGAHHMQFLRRRIGSHADIPKHVQTIGGLVRRRVADIHTSL